MTKSRAVVALILAAQLMPTATRAAPPEQKAAFPSRTPFEPDYADIAITGGALMLGGLSYALGPGELTGPHCELECSAAEVNVLDAWLLDTPKVPQAELASDALLGVTLLLPVVGRALEILGEAEGRRAINYAVDMEIMGQALAVTLALNTVVKLTVRRPRPLAYDGTLPDEVREETDSALSFYSGHTALSFAAATSYTTMLALRYQGPNYGHVVGWTGFTLHALAATTGALRIASHKHFLTDVVLGATLGSAVGFLVPWFHYRAPTASADDVADSELIILPMAFGAGGGVHLIF